jgi:hypothetical protein
MFFVLDARFDVERAIELEMRSWTVYGIKKDVLEG